MEIKKVWVIDIEVCKSAFTYTALDINTQSIKQYIIHKDLNQLKDLYNHLIKECSGHVTFNGVNFDYPVLHYLMINFKKFITYKPSEVIDTIFLER